MEWVSFVISDPKDQGAASRLQSGCREHPILFRQLRQEPVHSAELPQHLIGGRLAIATSELASGDGFGQVLVPLVALSLGQLGDWPRLSVSQA